MQHATVTVPLRRNRDFVLLWTGNWVSFVGARMSSVCFPLLTLWLTGGSASAAGIVGFAELLPNLLVQLPAGALVDRWDRRKVMLGCATGRLIALGSLALATATGELLLTHLLIVVFVDASLATFHMLAERGSVRSLVPPHQLGSALSQNEARGRGGGLIGGSLGPVLFTFAKASPFLVAAAGALVALLSVAMIRKPCQAERVTERRHLVYEVSEGFRWLCTQRFLRVAVALSSVSGLLLQLLPLGMTVILVKENHYAESSLGVLLAISGVGGLLGALSARWFVDRIPLPAIVICGFGSWALLLPGMAMTTSPAVLGALFALMNVTGAVFGVAGAIYQVEVTPDAMQGRAAGTMNFIVSGTGALGMLGSGFLLDALGGANSMLIAAAMMLAVTLAAAASPAVRQVRRTVPTADPVAAEEPARKSPS